jgi:hypothetical protein
LHVQKTTLTNAEGELHSDELAMKIAGDNLGALYRKWNPPEIPPEEFTACVDAIAIAKAKLEVGKKKIEELKITLMEAEDTKATYEKGIHVARIDLQEVITKVTLCPVDLFPKLPKIPGTGGGCASSSSEARCLVGCKYCDRGFVANTYVPLSCGCKYHPPCMIEMIFSGRIQCIQCGARIHGSWMATWGMTLDTKMQCQVEEDQVTMDADPECVAPIYHSLAYARVPAALVHPLPGGKPKELHVELHLQRLPHEVQSAATVEAVEAVQAMDNVATVTTNTPMTVETSPETNVAEMPEPTTPTIGSTCACTSD